MKIHLPIGPKGALVEVAASEIRGPFVYVDLAKQTVKMGAEYRDLAQQGYPFLVVLPSSLRGEEGGKQHYLMGPFDPRLADELPSWFRFRFPGFAEKYTAGGLTTHSHEYREFEKVFPSLTEQEVYDAHALMVRIPPAFRTIAGDSDRARRLKEDLLGITIGFAVPGATNLARSDAFEDLVQEYDKEGKSDKNDVVVWLGEDGSIAAQARVLLPDPEGTAIPGSGSGPRAFAEVEFSKLEDKPLTSPVAAATLAFLFGVAWDDLGVVLDVVTTGKHRTKEQAPVYVRLDQRPDLEPVPLVTVLGAALRVFQFLSGGQGVYEALATELFDANALATPSAVNVLRRTDPYFGLALGTRPFPLRGPIEAFLEDKRSHIEELVWRTRGKAKEAERQALQKLAEAQVVRVKAQKQSADRAKRQNVKRQMAEKQTSRQRFKVVSPAGAVYVVSFDPTQDAWVVRIGGKEKLVRRGYDPSPREIDVIRALGGWGAERIARTAAKEQAGLREQVKIQRQRPRFTPGPLDVSVWDPSGARYVAVHAPETETWELVKVVRGQVGPLGRIVSRGWKPTTRDVERAAAGWSTEAIEAAAVKQQQVRQQAAAASASKPEVAESGFDRLWRALGVTREQAGRRAAARQQAARAQRQKGRASSTTSRTILDLSDEE